jgi:hypothetical protein
MIGDGQGVHAQLFGAIDQPIDWAGPIKQAEMAVAMQMYKGTSAHGEIPVERAIRRRSGVNALILTIAAKPGE